MASLELLYVLPCEYPASLSSDRTPFRCMDELCPQHTHRHTHRHTDTVRCLS